MQSELATDMEDAIILAAPEAVPAMPASQLPPPIALLSDRVAALAASLDVPAHDEAGRYEPDAFIAAVQKQHDALMRLEHKLSQQAATQRMRERDLVRREADVAFAEKRVKGREALVAMAEPRRAWWRW